MNIRGYGGQLKAGGRVAAAVLAWEASESGDGLSVHATLGQADPYWLGAAAEYDVTLQLGSRSLRWRRLPVVIQNGIASFRVGREISG